MSDVVSPEGSDGDGRSGVDEDLRENFWKIVAFVVLASILIVGFLGLIRFFAANSYGLIDFLP